MATATFDELLLSSAATKKFFARISLPETTDGCWEWCGTVTSQGYGHHYCGIETNKIGRVHRLAYECWVGKIPEGMTIDHLCRNRKCLNVNHLEVVSRGDNVRRARAAVTHCPRGHEYTKDNIRATKRLNGERSCLKCHRDREHARFLAKKKESVR